MHHLLKLILKILAKRAILRYKPIVIGITGSVGKTTTKEAVFAVLSRKFWVRKNEKNYNNIDNNLYWICGLVYRNWGQ